MTQKLDLACKDGKRTNTYKCTLLCLKKIKNNMSTIKRGTGRYKNS